MNRLLFQNHNSKPFDIEDLYVCLNLYIKKFNKKPNSILISSKSQLDESLIPIDFEKVDNVHPYQFQIGHTEDIEFGIKKHEGESPAVYTLNRTQSAVEPRNIVKATDTPRKDKRGRRGGSSVYATINNMPSMMFDTKEEAADYFGCSVSSININISDSTKSGGLLKIDGIKIKLDWSYDD